VGLASGDWLAKQDTFDGWRHLPTSFLPIDALDGSFGAERLSVVHTAPPERWYSRGAQNKTECEHIKHTRNVTGQ
jgi:hypothetical protein